MNLIQRNCRNLLYRKMRNLKEGYLEFEENYSGEIPLITGFGDPASSLKAKIKILKPDAFPRMVFGGSIGAGEGYFLAEWESSELTDLIRLMVRNRETLNSIDRGGSALARPAQKAFHLLHRNTLSGAKKNIEAHYDLGNDFFELFLDESWLYSSAVYSRPEMSLHEAQIEKVDRICRKLALTPADHVVEVGTGWGGFAIHAAKKYGCKVTTTTISKAQLEHAREWVAREGLNDRIRILYEDYRKLEGHFDKLVSIEMIEAVGLENLDGFIKKCSDLLKPEGLGVIQAITIREEYFEAAKNDVDFIQRYIFPGTGICSIGSILASVAKGADLSLIHSEDFGTHYARTLRAWSERLKMRVEDVLKRGYSEQLYRMWQFYFSYCEGGFLERSIGVSQLTFAKPRASFPDPLRVEGGR
jgi:cyclopropane-fatty-acyl-phospholipid synthase